MKLNIVLYYILLAKGNVIFSVKTLKRMKAHLFESEKRKEKNKENMKMVKGKFFSGITYKIHFPFLYYNEKRIFATIILEKIE